MRNALVAFGLLILTLSVGASQFGADDRILIHSNLREWQAISRAVAIMIPRPFIHEVDSKHVSFETVPLTESWGLCSTERFATQPSFYVSCTGFLIAPDLLLTAGHCMVNFGEAKQEVTPQCRDFVWAFDYKANLSGKVDSTSFPREQIFACEKVIVAKHTTKFQSGIFDFSDDYAIVKLKNAVSSRHPLKLSSESPMRGERISMLGHPLGGPQILSKGKVLEIFPQYLRTNLEAFDGNSGSPVLNSKKEVIGILVRGFPESFVYDPIRKCSVINKCDEEAHRCSEDQGLIAPGEHVFPISKVPRPF